MTDILEEDYRVKNAREGKALYIPGKSTAQMKAELAAEKAAADAKVKPLKLTAEETERFSNALGLVSARVSQAENAFALLSAVQTSGDFDGHHGLADFSALAAAALSALGDKELEDLSDLNSRLRAGS